MTASPPRRPRAPLGRLEQAAANALEVMRFGRLGPRLGAPYAVTHQGKHHRLRRYGAGADAAEPRPPLLLVPPLAPLRPTTRSRRFRLRGALGLDDCGVCA